ncbi:ArnT family glycosyltransferase [Sciscionella sediminilitoris]|uniref:ArnT family glycosyltransferase n=1 Tax=Sciscionella sediminilitoris TaxID=1445613 RepID=UPI0005663E93|nr:glycosyltransferase family 39 protein [Sciscionella sp. SE31]
MTTTVTETMNPEPRTRTRLSRLLLGPETQAVWVRPAVLALLCLTALLYTVNLSVNGYANEFYAAAVQAGAQDWKAWLFGSLDPANAITVDKPPAALWLMVLSARILGFSSLSLLLPQALAGVAAVGLLYATVRRWSGPGAGLLAGLVLAATPVATLMFRFDNPDALLVLLLVAAAYCTVRATEQARPGWLLAAGVLIGFGFLTKMIQAFLVVPGFALVYLVASPAGLGRRIGHLLTAGLAIVVSAGWYVALVELWPSATRPFIGGSTDNSLLELALGYNGFGRIFGGEGNSGGGSGGGGPSGGPGGGPGGAANAMFGGSTGIGRLFGDSMGTQISWLLPAALLGLAAGLWFTRRGPRTDRTRAALLLWGGWLVVTGLVFSFMAGTVHPYYTVALAPAVAALVGIGARELVRRREKLAARWVLAAMLAATGGWGFVLLNRAPDWLPALRWIVLVLSLLLAALVVTGAHRARRFTVALAAMAVLTALTGSAAYAVQTTTTKQSGGIPIAGPAQPNMGDLPRGPGRAGPGGPDGARPGGMPGMSTSKAMTELLGATNTRWAAATVGANGAASMELATGRAVLAIGGFTGSDDSPTLEQFKTYVRDGEIAYFVEGGGPGGGHGGPPGAGERHPGGSGARSASAQQLTAWVKQHFTAEKVGEQTVYDLRS